MKDLEKINEEIGKKKESGLVGKIPKALIFCASVVAIPFGIYELVQNNGSSDLGAIAYCGGVAGVIYSKVKGGIKMVYKDPFSSDLPI